MTRTSVVSDSTFYICFLSDISRPDYLTRIITYGSFRFVIGPMIRSEVEKSSDFECVSEDFDRYVQMFGYYNYGELARPIFSIEEIEKGENEVFVISYILQAWSVPYRVVVDELGPRKVLQQTFPQIYQNLTGTIGFLEFCTSDCKIFSRDECIKVLKLIKKSEFRIKDEIVDETITKLEVG